MNKSVWEEAIREDADKEGMRPHDRGEGRICTKEGEGISAVKRGKGRCKRICKRAVEKEIYLAVKITTNGAGVLCRKERWKETDGAGLQVSERVDS